MNEIAQITKNYRFSKRTLQLLGSLSVRLTERDGERTISETEVIEKAIAALARREKLLPQA